MQPNLEKMTISSKEFRIPKVSIGMPVYNGEKFIREALDSLLAQTFTDFELIISDNASTDGTENICREYVSKDERIQYIRQPLNMGGVANFQFVLDKAMAEYFMWAAADDVWINSFIEKCKRILDERLEIGFAMSGYVVVSRLSSIFDCRYGIKDLDFIQDKNVMTRVYKYTSLGFLSHKDNLVYSLWRISLIRKIIENIRASARGAALIGGSMNEYALSLSQGYFLKEKLFKKRYKYVPPGSGWAWLFDIASAFTRFMRGEVKRTANAYGAQDHLSDLEIIMRLANHDDAFVRRVIEANKQHMKIGGI